MAQTITARFPGHCTGCGGDIKVGERITNQGGWRHANCTDPEYAAGRAAGNLHSAEVKMYGRELADQFQAEDEFNRYWKYGEDY